MIRSFALVGTPLDLDMLAQTLGCDVERLGDDEVTMPFATFALRWNVRDGKACDPVMDVPSDRTTIDEPARSRVARIFLTLGFSWGVSWAVPNDALPDLTDELAIHTWLALPPPPTAQEAFELAMRQLAIGVRPDAEVLSRAYAHPDAHVLMERLAIDAPAWGTLPEPGSRSQAELLRVTYTFNAYVWIGPLGTYANRIRSRFRKTGELPNSPVAVRVCLFFEARRRVHIGSDPTAEDWRYYDALLDVLRTATG